jgi:hypothetical protein
MIQISLGDDPIRTPFEVHGPALPGAQERDATALDGRQRVGRLECGAALAEHDGPGPYPDVKHQGIRSLSTMVERADRTNTSGWQYRPEETMLAHRSSDPAERIFSVQGSSCS